MRLISYLKLCELEQKMMIRLNHSANGLQIFEYIEQRDLTHLNEISHSHGRRTRGPYSAMDVNLAPTYQYYAREHNSILYLSFGMCHSFDKVNSFLKSRPRITIFAVVYGYSLINELTRVMVGHL